MIKTLPKTPLTFKQAGRETVFARDSVKSVKLLKLTNRSILYKGQPSEPDTWQLDVNDITVFKGSEKGARRHQLRALRYIR